MSITLNDDPEFRADIKSARLDTHPVDPLERIARAWGYASWDHLIELEKAEFVQFCQKLEANKIDQK